MKCQFRLFRDIWRDDSMELMEYKEFVIGEVKVSAALEMSTDKEEFLNFISERLIDAEAIEDFEYLPFEGLGKKGRKIQIDGYSYNELDEYLTIFVAPPLTYLSEGTLISSEAEKILARAQAFIEDTDYILKNAEESSPGYGLAFDITNRYKNVRKYRICLLTDMVMSNKIKELKPGQLNGKSVEYHIWDVHRLHQMDESSNGKEDIVIDLKEFVKNGIPCLPASETEDYKAYLCNIPGIVLANLYNTYGGRLLEGNVRSFLQTKGKVNKGIRNTILNSPTLFFAYNNGIAATAYNIELADIDGVKYITNITGLQIVNGGQTTASLAMALLNDKKDNSEENLNEIYVPMKLSLVSPEKAQKLIPDISRFANSQNKVSDADLWSNHPFHIRMEDFSRRILAPAAEGKQYGTHWYYERANGQYKQETYKCTPAEKKKFDMLNPSYQMFKKTDLAKYMNLLHMRPDIASSGGQKSFAKFAEGITKKWDMNDAIFNEEYYRRIVSLAIIFKESDRIVKNQVWYNSYKANIVAYTIAMIIYLVEVQYPEHTINFRNIWLKQTISSTWMRQIEIISKVIYDHLIDDRRQVENVTEWAKRESCWEQAKEICIKLLPEFIEELDYKDNEINNQKNAKKDQKLANKMNVMLEVANFGVENWKLLLDWDRDHEVLSLTEKDFINTAIAMEAGKFPSEKQCVRIIEILKRARIESFPK